MPILATFVVLVVGTAVIGLVCTLCAWGDLKAMCHRALITIAFLAIWLVLFLVMVALAEFSAYFGYTAALMLWIAVAIILSLAVCVLAFRARRSNTAKRN